MRRFFLLLLFVFLCQALVAQVDDLEWQHLLEQWAEENDSELIPDDISELMMTYLENPVNLNDTLSEALMDFPFVSDFQRDVIRAYIQQNGQMLSISELYLLNGFDTMTLKLMLPFITVAPVDTYDTLTFGDIFQRGHSNLLLGTKTVFPRSRGYLEDYYAGSPFRMYFRYSFKYKERIALQLSGEKDPGEPFLGESSPIGFDYYGYLLILNDFGIFKHTVIGKYRLQFGQGLTLWTGYAPWFSGNYSLWRYGQGVRSASAFAEYGYLCGVATTLDILPRWNMTLFYSNVNRDATAITDSVEDEELYFSNLYETGYHRTATEISKKYLLNEQLVGGRIQYTNNHMVVGSTLYGLFFDKPLLPVENVYNAFTFRGMRNFNGGLDFSYRRGRLLLFGETAVSLNDSTSNQYRRTGWIPFAALAGMQLHFDANNLFSVSYRYGSPIYHNLYSNTIGQSSTVQNEEDICVYLQTRLPWFIVVRAYVDWFRVPWMRYRIYSPSQGVDYRLHIQKSIAPKTMLSVQYRHKNSMRNCTDSMYYTEQISRRQMQISLEYTPSDSWRLLSRVAYSWFRCEKHEPLQGFLAFQEVSYNAVRLHHPFSIALRMAIFDIEGYDARIYMYESDMIYEFNVPMLMDRGLRCYCIFRQQISKDITFALKYAVAFFPDRTTLGSGYDIIEGNIKHEVKAQLRLKF